MASKYDYLKPKLVELFANTEKSAYSIAKQVAEEEDLNHLGFYDWVRRQGLSDTNSFEEGLTDNGFGPPENWSHGWLKTENASIFIKNKESLISYDDIREEIIGEMKIHAPKYKERVYKNIDTDDDHALVIDIADLHIGKLAVKSETGEDYNMDIAIKRALEGVHGLLQKARGYEFSKIYFIIGNDILHIDKTNRTTTANTPQDTDGMWYESFTAARKLYTEILEFLSEIAPVHVIHCPSNHDFMSGYMLADTIYSWFHNNPNITWDVSNNHRKYAQYGNSLLGFSHGDGAKLADMPLLMAQESAQLWADTKYRYVYLHHVHHKQINVFNKAKDFPGVCVEHLRSPSGTDSWHHRNGYSGGIKAIEAFIHSIKYGQVAKLCHNF